MEEGEAKLIVMLADSLLANAGDTTPSHQVLDLGRRQVKKPCKEGNVDDEAVVLDINFHRHHFAQFE